MSGTLAQAEALHTLFDETVGLFHRLNAEAQRVHGEGGLTAALRGVLRGLQQRGPQTVPQMARIRPVSRQHVQGLVDRLHSAGWVELQENPAHKRSPLVRLTPAGERKLRAMMDREELLLAQLQLPCSREQVRRAAQVLHSVRLAFEGEQWNRLVRSKY